MRAAPWRSGSSARRSTSRPSTTGPADRTWPRACMRQQLLERRRQLFAAPPSGICHASRRRRSRIGAAARIQHERRRLRERAELLPPAASTPRVEAFEVDVLGARASRSTSRSAASKNASVPSAAAIRLDLGRELGDERQRKIASDPIDARRHQPDDRRRTARAGAHRRIARPDSSGRRRASARRAPSRLAARHSLQPGVPRVDERVRDAPAQEIAVARQLAVEADSAWRFSAPQRNCRQVLSRERIAAALDGVDRTRRPA